MFTKNSPKTLSLAFRCSPIKIAAWSLGVRESFFAIPFVFMLLSLIAGQYADIMYFSVRIFFNSIISIFFNKVKVAELFSYECEYKYCMCELYVVMLW